MAHRPKSRCTSCASRSGRPLGKYHRTHSCRVSAEAFRETGRLGSTPPSVLDRRHILLGHSDCLTVQSDRVQAAHAGGGVARRRSSRRLDWRARCVHGRGGDLGRGSSQLRNPQRTPRGMRVVKGLTPASPVRAAAQRAASPTCVCRPTQQPRYAGMTPANRDKQTSRSATIAA